MIHVWHPRAQRVRALDATPQVPNLYAADETEKIVGLVRPLAKAAGKLETRDAILQHYVQLVRENLHVVLCMSPIGAGFRNRCRMFPSLVNCCTVDWFNVRCVVALRKPRLRGGGTVSFCLGGSVFEAILGVSVPKMVKKTICRENAPGLLFK